MTQQLSHNLPQMADDGNPRAIFLVAGAESGAEPLRHTEGRRNAPEEAGAQRRRLPRLGGVLALAALGLMAAGAHAQLTFQSQQKVGTTSGAVAVTVTSQGAGTVSRVEVLTQGEAGLDFGAAGSGSNCPAKVFSAANQTCTESVTFTPAYPGLRLGAVVLLDNSNKVLGTAYLSGVGQGGLAVLMPGNLLELAGIFRQTGGPVNGGLATSEELYEPSSVALDGAGNVYIADSFNNQVRMICAGANSSIIAGVSCSKAGILVEVAGNGVPQAGVTFNYPTGVALDGAGNLYIADKRNNVIRKMTAATGALSTVAGDGYIDPNTGFGGYTGDNGPATAAELNFPQGVTVDVNGNLFIADTDNQRIRRVDAVTGTITTAAGNGTAGAGGDSGPATSANLNLPFAVAFDSSGNMYIPDSANDRIREVAAVSGLITPASMITTAVGTGGGADACADGPTGGAALSQPSGVAIDAAGNLYISDPGNLCVRKTNAVSSQINQIAITGDFYLPVNRSPGRENIYAPQGIVLDGAGNVYFADHYNMLVDEIQSNKAALNFTGTAVRQGTQSAALPQIVENGGNASLDVTALTPDANAAVLAINFPATCDALPLPLTADADCVVGAIFAPSVAGNPLLGNIDVINSTTINNPLDIVLVGDATPVNTTTISVAPNTNPSEFGKNVTFTATIQTGSGTGNLTGEVDYYDGATLLGVAAVGASTTSGNSTTAQSQFSTKTLTVGSHSITVSYDNKFDPSHSVSTSAPPVMQVVYEATKTALKAVPASPSPLGASVTFTATVTAPDGGAQPLDGSVTFTDSLAVLPNNTVALAGGVASYSTAALVQGLNVITGTYTPATTNLIQGSTDTLNQDVVAASAVTVTSSPNPSNYGSPVTFTVTVPNSGAAPATGKVNIVIVPQGQTSPTYPLTVTLAGNPGSGTAAISALPVGTYTATANYVGDTNYGAGAGALANPQVVNQVQTTSALAAVPQPGIAGQPVAITATVTPNSGTATPTGTVTFTATLNGVNVPLAGAANVALAAGAATINPALGPGTYSILATYSGDADDAGSTATLSLTVNQAITTTTVTAAPSPTIVGATITFTATVVATPAGGTPTGSVTFTAAGPNGAVALGNANLAAGVAKVTSSTLPAGTYTITAAYTGDTNDAKSTGTTSEVVGLIPTTTDLTSATVNGADVLIAVVQNNGVTGPTPTGTVTFTDGATVIGKATLDANGVATLTPNLASGNYTIVAGYGGDKDHSPSTSPSIGITGVASNFTITVKPDKVSVPVTQNVAVQVTLTSISGFADTIDLGCAGLPAGVNCHFSSIGLPVSANGTATTQLAIDTNNPLGGGASAMNRRSGSRGISLAGLLLPFSLLLGCVVWRFRRRHASLLSTVLLLVLGGAALLETGCSGFTQSYATPGTYTIQVIGVGQNSNVTQYANVTLTITAK